MGPFEKVPREPPQNFSVSEASKPPYVHGPKADGIHLRAVTGTGAGHPFKVLSSLHPQGLTVSSALQATSPLPDHRISLRPFRCCDIATTLAACPLQAFVCPGGGGTFLTHLRAEAVLPLSQINFNSTCLLEIYNNHARVHTSGILCVV